MNDTEKYLDMLVGGFVEQNLYFSIHRKMLFADGHTAIPGSAFTNIHLAARVATWWGRGGHDIYLAMGGQKEVGKKEGTRKHPPAIRKRHNIGLCSSIYLDVDVKDGAYPTHQEAVSKLNGFIIKYDLPTPSLFVSSGTGGVHAYWVSDELFTTIEHQTLSTGLINKANEFGLLFDQECSIDLCRLLRVPGTFNFKREPALPVQLLYYGSKIPLSVLREKFNEGNVVQFRPSPNTPYEPDANDDLMRQKKEYALVDFKQVRKYCGFLDNTYNSGGREHDNIIWHQTVLLASYCENGRKLAHMLSKDYVGRNSIYSVEETDDEYDQIEIEKTNNRKLGPTKCDALKRLGVKECETCVHFALGTTPINVPERVAAAQQRTTPRVSASLPPVGGKPLLSTLPPQEIFDIPGSKAHVVETLDQRMAADPYTFQSGDRLISLRIPPPVAVLFPHLVDKDETGGTTPAITDEGDMPVMLETTSADVLFITDVDHWMGYVSGRVEKGKEREFRRIRPTTETCIQYLKLSRAKIGIRPLLGLARVPIINNKGDLDFNTGYHEATGIFRDRVPILDVPDNPTLADCQAALNVLGKPFQKYTFDDQKMGFILILTLIFTALERPFIRTAPMFGINGIAGVGKGKLIRAITQLAFDTKPRFMTYGFNDEEFDKRIATMFRTPAPCIVIDNANSKRISNATLESIITESEGYIRTLGRNEDVHVIVRSLLVATGRGLEFSGDMTRRVLILNPIAKSASPETRKFKLDPPTYVTEHRDELLTAAFTIMRAFRQEKQKPIAKTSAGSFPEWERRVRDLILWLTDIDVTDQFARNRETAYDKQTGTMLLHALIKVFENKPFRAGMIHRIYENVETEKRRGLYTFPLSQEEVMAGAKAAGERAVEEFKKQSLTLGVNNPNSGKTDNDIRVKAEQEFIDVTQGGPILREKARNEFEVYEALKETDTSGKQITPARIGYLLKDIENTYLDGLLLERIKEDGRAGVIFNIKKY